MNLEIENKEKYIPDDEERDFITKVYSRFQELYQLKMQSYDLLGGYSLQDFWDKSNYDYGVITEQSDENDPVKQYSSSISRDKADVFIANLVSQMMYPSVTAQNKDQEIDKVIARISRSLLEWSHNMDGYPSESGHQKMTRYIHKMVVEGTIHIQDDIIDGKLVSNLVPNEEIFVPNFWQPDIQKQGILLRVQNNVSYFEAEEEFGELENFKKYVQPGFQGNFVYENPLFKDFFQGLLEKDKVSIIRVWCPVQKKDLPVGREQAKYFNVIINGVLMFPVDTMSPYKDGFYPISKGIFTKFAKPEFYWGNSMPNKVKEDKDFLDNWKTLLRYKAKLNLLPPMISKNGMHIDEEIILPARITAVQEDTDLKRIEGVADPISQADISMLQMAENEIDRGTVAPRTGGQSAQGNATAREVVIEETNAQKLLDVFSLEVGFLMNARTIPVLLRLFQYISKDKIKKICIPNQTLSNGRRGTYEIVFEKLPDMTEEERLKKSLEIRQMEMQSIKNKEPKQMIYVNPSYLKEIELYVRPDSGVNAINRDQLNKSRFRQDIQLYLSRPDLFNVKEAARIFVQNNEDDESILNEEGEVQQMQKETKEELPMSGGMLNQEMPELEKLPV